MKKYALFYHLWSPPATKVWALLIDEQIKRIISSKVKYNADIYCCISGKECSNIENYVREYKFINILEVTENESEYEGLTLKHLYQFCLDQKSKPEIDRVDAVGYMHTKGVRHFAVGEHFGFLKSLNSWRHFLEYGILDRSKDCIMALQGHDVAGVNFHLAPQPHFQGNFWWATVDYVASLDHPLSRIFVREGIAAPDWEERLSCEMWIGSNNPKWFSLYSFPFQADGKTQSYDLYNDDIFPIFLNNSMK